MSQVRTFLLVGNSNVGKSTYYNKITWKTSSVGNIDSLTTCSHKSRLRKNKETQVVDLPGIWDLNPCRSDELVAIDYLINGDHIGIINIAAATTLKRDLMLTYELAETGILSGLTINMVDELENKEISIYELAKEFKIKINLISAKKSIGIINSLNPMIEFKRNAPVKIINYSLKITALIEHFANIKLHHKISNQAVIIQSVLGSTPFRTILANVNQLDNFEQKCNELQIDKAEIINIRETKKELINKLYNRIIKTTKTIDNKTLTNKEKINLKLDNFFLNPKVAIPAFILIITAIYFLTFYKYCGGYFQEQIVTGFEQLQGIITNAIILHGNSDTILWGASFVANGLLGGLFTILSFLPWIIILLVLTTILEQIGMLSRMSVIFDKTFSRFGLSGRSLVNVISGIGCNIPAIIMARNSNSQQERVISIMIAPLISCSARAIVFGFISMALIGNSYGWLLNLGMLFFSVFVTLTAGLIFSNSLFRKRNNIFAIEIPRWRTPDFKYILKRTYLTSINFLKNTVLIIMIANLIVWILSNTGPNHNFILDLNDKTAIKNSFIRYLAYPFQYLLYPIGLGTDWRFSVSLLTSFPAKEIAATNIENLFGSSVLFKAAIMNQGLLNAACIASFMLFFAFFIPCMATVSVMKKEIQWKYTLMHIAISLSGSYLGSFVFFNIIGDLSFLARANINSTFPFIILISLLFAIISFIIINLSKRYQLQNQGKTEKTGRSLKIKKLNYGALGLISTIFIINDVLLLTN